MMIGRDDFLNELLSAYVDDEVSSDEREQIAQRLAGSAEDRNRLETLRALQQALRELPRYRLATEVHERIMREIQSLTAADADVPQSLAIEPELLSAYFDGEVTDSERQHVERVLAEDTECRERLDELHQLDATLRQLSSFSLGDGFVERVKQQIAADAVLADGAAPAAVQRPQLPQRAGTRNPASDVPGWRSWVWTALAVAVALMLMVHFRADRETRRDIADSGADSDRVPPGVVSPLTLVDHRLRDRLLLVYEVAVTPEGVRQDAFARLLKRHDIRVLDMVPVPAREQRALLACRFLQGVQSVGVDAAGDIDRVQMYLVHCTASQAESISDELIGRPEGFASFSMNLTTRDAGNGILPRLAGAAGKRRLGEAVQLVGNFGILSHVGRQLGTFGTIGYIDPDLLAPPETRGQPAQQQAEPDAAAQQPGDLPPPAAVDDFRCELLFVVRNLRPLSRDEEPRILSMAR